MRSSEKQTESIVALKEKLNAAIAHAEARGRSAFLSLHLDLVRILNGENNISEISPHSRDIQKHYQKIKMDWQTDLDLKSLQDARKLMVDLKKTIVEKYEINTDKSYDLLEEDRIITTRSQLHLPISLAHQNFTENEISTEDGRKIRAWIKPPEPGKPTVAFFSDRNNTLNSPSVIEQLEKYARLGYGVACFDSQCDNPINTEPGVHKCFHEDRAMMDYIVNTMGISKNQLFCAGQNGGATHATKMATEYHANGLFLIAPSFHATAEPRVLSTQAKMKLPGFGDSTNLNGEQLGLLNKFEGDVFILDKLDGKAIAMANNRATYSSSNTGNLQLAFVSTDIHADQIMFFAQKLLDGEMQARTAAQFDTGPVFKNVFLTQNDYRKLSSVVLPGYDVQSNPLRILRIMVSESYSSEALLASTEDRRIKKAFSINALLNLIAENIISVYDEKTGGMINTVKPVDIMKKINTFLNATPKPDLGKKAMEQVNLLITSISKMSPTDSLANESNLNLSLITKLSDKNISIASNIKITLDQAIALEEKRGKSGLVNIQHGLLKILNSAYEPNSEHNPHLQRIAAEYESIKQDEINTNRFPSDILEIRKIIFEKYTTLQNQTHDEKALGPTTSATFADRQQALNTKAVAIDNITPLLLSGFEEKKVPTEDGRQIRLVVKPAEDGKPTIVCFEDRNNILSSVAVKDRLIAYADKGYGVLCYDTQCDNPKNSEPGIGKMFFEDQAIMDFAIHTMGVSQEQLYCAGHEGGSAHAAEMAKNYQARGLLLVNPQFNVVATEGIVDEIKRKAATTTNDCDIQGNPLLSYDTIFARTVSTSAGSEKQTKLLTNTAAQLRSGTMGRYVLEDVLKKFEGDISIVDKADGIGVALATRCMSTGKAQSVHLDIATNKTAMEPALRAALAANDLITSPTTSRATVQYGSDDTQTDILLSGADHQKLRLINDDQCKKNITALRQMTIDLLNSKDPDKIKEAFAINGLLNLVATYSTEITNPNTKLRSTTLDATTLLVKTNTFLEENPETHSAAKEKIDQFISRLAEIKIEQLLSSTKEALEQFEHLSHTPFSSILSAHQVPHEATVLASQLKKILGNDKLSAEEKSTQIENAVRTIDPKNRNVFINILIKQGIINTKKQDTVARIIADPSI